MKWTKQALRSLEESYQEEKSYAKQAAITTVFYVLGLHAFAVEASETFTKLKRVWNGCV